MFSQSCSDKYSISCSLTLVYSFYQWTLSQIPILDKCSSLETQFLKGARAWCEDLLSQVVLDGVSSSPSPSPSNAISSGHGCYCPPAIEALLTIKSANNMSTIFYKIQEQLLLATERFVDQSVTIGMEGKNNTITSQSPANFSLLSMYIHCMDLCSKDDIRQAIISFVDTSHSISADERFVLLAMIEE